MKRSAKTASIRPIPGTDNYRVTVEFLPHESLFPTLDYDLPASAIDFQIRLDGYQYVDIAYTAVLPRRPRVSEVEKLNMFLSQEEKCNGCRREFVIEKMEVDHIIPWVLGGPHEMINLQLLCKRCNRTKGRRSMQYLVRRLIRKGILPDPNPKPLYLLPLW